MTQATADAFFDHRLWRPILDRGNAAFSGLVSGASIGIMPRRVAAQESGPMLVWQAADGIPSITHQAFDGFESCDVDMVLVVDDDALARLRDSAAEDAIAELRRLVRRGHIVLYFLKCEGALIEAGFEPFLDSLGLTIMGACR